MKKLLLLLLCVPLMFSCGDNKNDDKINKLENRIKELEGKDLKKRKKTSLDINIDNLKHPCDFLDAYTKVLVEVYSLGQENNWIPLTEGSDELKQLNDMYKIQAEIRYTGGEMMKELEFNMEECDDFEEWEQNIEDKGRKIQDWIREFEELLYVAKSRI